MKTERKPISLEELNPGSLFKYNDTIALKTEYYTENGAVEAYIIGSGEMFWGGTDNPLKQRKIMVIPIDETPITHDTLCPARPEEAYTITEGDEINSFLMVIMRRLNSEQLIILRDALIERTPRARPEMPETKGKLYDALLELNKELHRVNKDREDLLNKRTLAQDLCRSMISVAERKGESTNWEALIYRCKEALQNPDSVWPEMPNEKEQNLICPFCGKSGFDKIGLKIHLEDYCPEYYKIFTDQI